MGLFDTKRDKVKQFEEVTKGRTKEDKRKAEGSLLKPERLPNYDGDKPKHKSELHSRTALIVFNSKEQQKLIGEIFHIKTSVQGVTYITDVSLLGAIAKGVRDGKYQIVDNEIQLVTGPRKSREHWHENEEGTIKVHLPDAYFEPLTDEQVQSLTKKQRKKYDKIVSWGNVKKMNKFRAKHFPAKNTTEDTPKNLRKRRIF